MSQEPGGSPSGGLPATEDDSRQAGDGGQHGVTRRALITGGGAGVGALVVGGAIGYGVRGGSSTKTVTSPATPTTSAQTGSMSASSSAPTILPMRWFSTSDAAVIGALADRIYPADADGPGATELGVVNYIDGQLAGPWGTGERMYRQGPFAIPADTGHGWQYAMTPADAYRVAIDALNSYTRTKYDDKTYDGLTTTQQDSILADLAGGKIPTFTTLQAADFFTLLLENVKEGIFSDPSYGGNRDVEGWKLIRWPGDPMAHGDDQYKYVTDYSYYPPGPPQPMVLK